MMAILEVSVEPNRIICVNNKYIMFIRIMFNKKAIVICSLFA